MKKTIVSIITMILLVAFLSGCSMDPFGCSGNTVTLATGDKAPWHNGLGYERVEYDIAKNDYRQKNGNEDFVTVAEGKYVTELIEVKTLGEYPVFPLDKLNLTADAGAGFTVLRTSSTLTYNNKSEFNGKTDTVTVDLLFYSSDLYPVYLHKESTCESDPTNSYSLATDYVNLTNKGDIDGEAFDVPVTKDKVYDSELMFFVIRALSSLGRSGTGSLSVYSAADSALQGKSVVFPMAFQCQNQYANVVTDKDDKFVKNCFQRLPEKNNDGYYLLPSIITLLNINATNRGAPILLSYSAEPFVMLGASMSNVLTSFIKQSYDIETATLAFTSEYTISNYSIQK